jgi:hypothetical protein
MADRNGSSARRRASRRTGTSADSTIDQARASVGRGIDPTRIGVARPASSTGISIVRHTDLAVLTVDWRGRQVNAAEDGVTRLVKDGDDPAYLVLEFSATAHPGAGNGGGDRQQHIRCGGAAV